MKQLLTVAALDEAAEKHCDIRRNVEVYTESFKAVQHEAMEFSVMYDGELYQLEKLHEELRQADFPDPSSLEETALYAYLPWDEKAMEHMEGAYSFTTRKGGSLLYAEDSFGLRPIYYLTKDNCIWISCRIQPPLDAPDTPVILSREGPLELSTFGPNIGRNQTLYKDVHALPMGSLFRISAGKLEIKAYYKPSAHPHTDTLQETITKVHDLMSVSIRAQASGAQASFLSGGLDSSLITSIAAEKNPQWRTYSLDYEGSKENFRGNTYQVSLDASSIQDMCKSCQCEHTPFMLSQQELCGLLEDAMLVREAPGMIGVDSSLLRLCREVVEKGQIILSGECSDEIFGGYPWFCRDELKDLDILLWLRSTKERISSLHSDLQSLPYGDYTAKRYVENIQDIEYLDTDSDEDHRVRTHTVLCLHWLMQTLVTRQVCMGDAAHLNIRTPFTSAKLLEYVYNIPWEMKPLKQEEKDILQKVSEHKLPESVTYRKKNPFPRTCNSRYVELVSRRLQECYEDPTNPLHEPFDDVKLRELIDTKRESFQLPWYG